MEPHEVLAGLEQVEWSRLQDAYGAADHLPATLRSLLSPVEEDRLAAIDRLWGTVWHQGTVYGCSPPVIPFLAAVAASPVADDAVREQVLLLLASMAAADSFVLPAGSASERRLDRECRTVVAESLPTMAGAVDQGDHRLRVAYLAVLAASDAAGGAAGSAIVDELVRHGDPRVAAAARITHLLADGEVGALVAAIEHGARLDEETSEHVADLTDQPVPVQAREVVGDLVHRFLSA